MSLLFPPLLLLSVLWPLSLARPAEAASGAGQVAGAGWVELPPFDLDRVPGVSTTEERRTQKGRTQVRILLDEQGRRELERRGLAVTDYQPDHRIRLDIAGYHDSEGARIALQEAVARSGRAGMVRLGRSREGQPIDGAWFGLPPGQGAPVLRILGGHHGDEPIAVELALALARTLAERDGADERITALLDRSTVWIVPLINPDGLDQGSRTNAVDVDLNRNYDYAWDALASRAGSSPFSEPETRAVRTHALLERPMLSLSLHAGAQNLGWPWNFTTSDPKDAVPLALLAQRYREACTAPDFWITQGADWYPTHGDTNDWAYGRHGTLDFTLEVSLDKQPEPEAIPDVIAWHGQAILRLLSTPPSVQGQVLDAQTGEPVSASIRLDVPGVESLTDPLTGRFFRLAWLAGRVSAVAPGYAPAEVALKDGHAEIWLERTTLQAPPEDLPWLPEPGATLSDRAVTLWQPGAEAVRLEEGQAFAPEGLTPGWWTIEVQDGPVWPNALLVEERGEAEIEGWDPEGILVGRSFGEGTRVLAFWGESRAPVELAVLSLEEDAVEIDTSALPPEGRIDLVVLSAGSILGITDWLHPARAPGEAIGAGGCACQTTSGHLLGFTWSYMGWAPALGWVLTRRRRS